MAEGQPRKLYGDKLNPVYHGYSCIKGRELAGYHQAPSRLLQSLKRQGDGHIAISSDQAGREIAARLETIMDRHGPRAVATYIGTHGYNNFPASAFATAFMTAIGSPMLFTSVTIDQPGKAVALGLHGPWLGGLYTPDECDVLMLVGSNPVVSMNGGLGVNPARRLHELKARGLALIVIDPRRSETAARADLHVQPRPGEDAVVLAGIIRAILAADWHDADFVAAEADHLSALRQAVAPFTPEFVARRADIAAADVLRAAQLWGGGRRGGINCGTGPNMAGHGNLTEYLAKVLLTLRGFWRRAGDMVSNPGVLMDVGPFIAASPGPLSAWGFGEKMRMKGLSDTLAGLPTGVLADEILTPGDGQVKALIVLGGNPMLAWPDQLKTHAAMQALDLLVCVDPQLSATARLAHYVIAPKLPLEFASATALMEMLAAVGTGWGYFTPYAQYTPALLPPPPGSDVIEDWELFFDICRNLGLPMRIPPMTTLDKTKAAQNATPLDMSRKPHGDAVWDIIMKGSPVPFEQVRTKARRGHVFDVPEQRVAAKPAGWTGRLDIGNAVMMAELTALAAAVAVATDFRFLVISRRLHDVLNSCWHDNPTLRRRAPYNPAYFNPDDLARLKLKSGDVVEIDSARSSIMAVVEPDHTVRRGCISMTHAWGGNPDDDADPFTIGGNTGRLVSTDQDWDPYTGIPRMSAIAVNVRKVADSNLRRFKRNVTG